MDGKWRRHLLGCAGQPGCSHWPACCPACRLTLAYLGSSSRALVASAIAPPNSCGSGRWTGRQRGPGASSRTGSTGWGALPVAQYQMHIYGGLVRQLDGIHTVHQVLSRDCGTAGPHTHAAATHLKPNGSKRTIAKEHRAGWIHLQRLGVELLRQGIVLLCGRPRGGAPASGAAS